jgi:hypothetical protein
MKVLERELGEWIRQERLNPKKWAIREGTSRNRRKDYSYFEKQ